MRAFIVAAMVLLTGCVEVFMGNIEFPLAGMDRSVAFQRQRPYTTPIASNVRATGTVTGRGRGGSRPGLVRVTTGTPPGACQMLASVMPLDGTLERYWVDDFETLGQGVGIDPARWTSGLADMYDETYYYLADKHDGSTFIVPYKVSAGSVAAVATAPDLPIDGAEPYTITVTTKAFNITNASTAYTRILLCMDNTTPTYNNCISVIIQCDRHDDNDSDYTGEVDRRLAGVSTGEGFTFTPVQRTEVGTVTWTISVQADNTVTVYMDGTSVGSFQFTTVYGSRFAVSTDFVNLAGTRRTLIDSVMCNYTTTASALVTDYSKPLLYAIENGLLHQLQQDGALSAVSAVPFSGNLLQGVQYHGKLYIADYDTPLYEGTGGTISDSSPPGPGKFLFESGVDFTTVGTMENVDVARDVCVITSSAQAPTPVLYGAYKMVEATASSIELSDTPAAEDSSLVYSVQAGPKVYDPATGTLALWQQDVSGSRNLGVIPVGCPIIFVFRDRICFAKDNIIYQSRIGEPNDWDFGADPDDPARAIAGTQMEQAQIGRNITAVAPWHDDTVVYGADNELWLQLGDFGEGGQMLNLSRQVGIISRFAFCYTPGGNLVFLSSNGLYELSPGSRVPKPLSQDRLPQEMQNVDPALYNVVLSWHNSDYGIHIYISPKTGTSGASYWFYDLRFPGFQKMDLDSDHEPFAAVLHQPYGIQEVDLLLGGRDGHIRRYSDTSSTDDGETLTSYVLIGPLRAGDASVRSMWQSVTAILGSVSANVTWTIYAGDSPEEAYANYEAGTSRASGTWSAGRNTINRPKVSGQAFFIKLSSTGQWEMEEIVASIMAVGAYRPG